VRITLYGLDGLVVLDRDCLTDRRREARMRQARTVGQLLRNGMAKGETCEEALAEELHDHVKVPRLERVKRAIVGEGTLGRENVSVRLPLWSGPRGRTL
jgi:hypothetical protein